MNVVDEYLGKLELAHKLVLANISHIVNRTVPDAKPAITYGMPGYKYKDKYLISFGAFKDHLSIFPGANAIEAHKDSLNDFNISKGTIQFTAEHQLPDTLLVSIIKHRVRDIDA